LGRYDKIEDKVSTKDKPELGTYEVLEKLENITDPLLSR
jgi:hypothetical protein